MICQVEALDARTLLSTGVASLPQVARPAVQARVAAPTASPQALGSWTVMVYMTGSDLNQEAYENIKQMERLTAQLPKSVKITVLWDQGSGLGPEKNGKREPIPNFTTGRGSQDKWTTAGYAVIRPDGARDNPDVVTPFQITTNEINTGDPETLADFTAWSRDVAPARRYSLIMWNHGGGYQGLNFDTYDAQPKGNLTTQTFASALDSAKASGLKFDVLALDECLMATPEVLNDVRDHAKVIVASTDLVAGGGYDYEAALRVLTRRPRNVDARRLALSLVASFDAQYVPSEDADTLSAVRPAGLPPVVRSVQRFVRASQSATRDDWAAIDRARAEATPYLDERNGGNSDEDPRYIERDLGMFMRNVADTKGVSLKIRQAAGLAARAVNTAVLYKTRSKTPSSGLAIYLPDPVIPLDAQYGVLVPRFEAKTGWSEFLADLRERTADQV